MLWPCVHSVWEVCVFECVRLWRSSLDPVCCFPVTGTHSENALNKGVPHSKTNNPIYCVYLKTHLLNTGI